jgi:hypothetical protein
MRLAAYLAHNDGQICGTVVLSNSRYLVGQLIRQDKIAEMIKRYELDQRLALKVVSLRSIYRPFTGGAYLASATIQLACEQQEALIQLAELGVQSGKRLLVCIDESHECSVELIRGNLVERLIAAGAHVVLVTATPIRGDGGRIPGFKWRVLNEVERKNYTHEKLPDGKIKTTVFNALYAECKLIADHETTFQEAWQENPMPLCKLSMMHIDCDVTIDGKTTKLSEIPVHRVAQALSVAVRDPNYVNECAKHFVEQLFVFREVKPRALGIVYSSNDIDERSNGHAEQIKQAIHTQCELQNKKRLRIGIVTMKSSGTDSSGAEDDINNFVLGKSYDVLIVKQMGGAGLDCPELKVELDLSNYRSVATCLQRWNRVSTPWDGLNVGLVIRPKDALAECIAKEFVENCGGLSTVEISSQLESVTIKEMEQKETAQRLLHFDNHHLASFDDTDGNIGNIANFQLAVKLRKVFPHEFGKMTDAQISKKLDEVCEPQQAETDEEKIDRLRDSLFCQGNSLVVQIASAQMRADGVPYSAHEMKRRCSLVGSKIKSAAGVADLNVDQINDVASWSCMNTTALQMLDSVNLRCAKK